MFRSKAFRLTELDDTFIGSAASKHHSRTGGRDRILGGAGDDQLEGGAGTDELDGGSGEDTTTYRVASGAVSDRSAGDPGTT